MLRKRRREFPATVLTAVALVLCLLPIIAPAADFTLNNTAVKVYFSPEGGCTEGIVNEVIKARKEILIQMFSFTSGPIRNALLKAQKRGVSVRVILDQGEQKNQHFKTASILSRVGIHVFLDDLHSHAHNKVMIVDRETIATGSFNYTYGAENKNSENLIVIRSADLARAYADDWLKHKEHSRRY
jgi:phosphatidylserine/phosphatidylglycerophosphate/cardiolipin synthase-like enzyme